MSQTLHEAREYEAEIEKNIEAEQRPLFHLSSRVGWMNDPNGFSYYNGKYHMFYQYHPYNTNWGPMHWGHAISEDLLKWEFLPTALAPDEKYDFGGCFSGSALTLPDGHHLLMYTSVHKKKQSDGKEFDVQEQSIAVGDGIDYVKYEKNPVLNGDDLPEGASIYDFRDPKIWQKQDGSYACVVGNRASDKSGQILLFVSPDGFSWKYKKVFVANENRYGKMWECPDFFCLDKQGVLLVSPQEMLPQGFEYHSGNGTMCMIGNYDENTDTFTECYNQPIDYGIDFYAPQTTLAKDGRRIMIGWMQNWDTCLMRLPEAKWFGQMSLPRELSIVQGKLIQKPIRELGNYRRNKVVYSDVEFSDTLSLAQIAGRKIDMELEVDNETEGLSYRKFVIYFAQNEQFYTSISYYPYESIIEVDREFSGTRQAAIHQRKCKTCFHNGKIKLRLILDKYSAELFINDGEQVMTTTFYTPIEADNISFFAEGKVKMQIIKYDLEG